MRKILPLLLSPVLSLLAASGGQARVIVGNVNADGLNPGSINTFADGATGNVVPLVTIVHGPANPMNTANAVEYEANENVIYVADYAGHAIHVFDANGNGGATPLRTLTSSALTQPRIVRVDRAHEELVALEGQTRICTWPRLASGAQNPLRCIPPSTDSGSHSQLMRPDGLALNLARGEIVVGNTEFVSPNNGNILIFDRSADQFNNTPLRKIAGPATRLGTSVGVRVVVDEQAQLIIALAGELNPGAANTARILVFPADADGNVAPLRVIEGNDTGLKLFNNENVTGLGYDEPNRTVLVTTGWSVSTLQGRIFGQSVWSNGNALPVFMITGNQTRLGYRPGSPTATNYRIFRDGFD